MVRITTSKNAAPSQVALSFYLNLLAVFSVLALLTAPVLAQGNDGFLRVKIDPWNAGVYVDGKYMGTAAMYGHKSRPLSLKPGQYEVRFVDPRYEPMIVPVQIDAGKTTTIRRSMKPKAADLEGPFGELETEGFGNAAVYLNDVYYGNTSEFGTPGQSLLIKAGTYKLRIVPVDGGPAREEEITITADETLVLSKNAAPVRRR